MGFESVDRHFLTGPASAVREGEFSHSVFGHTIHQGKLSLTQPENRRVRTGSLRKDDRCLARTERRHSGNMQDRVSNASADCRDLDASGRRPFKTVCNLKRGGRENHPATGIPMRLRTRYGSLKDRSRTYRKVFQSESLDGCGLCWDRSEEEKKDETPCHWIQLRHRKKSNIRTRISSDILRG